jgi:outer membrane biosynthesis protein TonB
LEEERLKERESLTIGTSPRNTFVIPAEAMPKSHALFAFAGGHYELVFSEGMRGRITESKGGQAVDLGEFKKNGKAKASGGMYRLALTDAHRGKVVIGDATIIFQFVVPPPVPARPKLPAAAKGSIWQRIDWPYVAALLPVFFIETGIILKFQTVDPPAVVTFETMDNRFAQLIVPELKKEEKPPEPRKDDGPKLDAAAKAKDAEEEEEEAEGEAEAEVEKADPAKAKAKAEKQQKIRENIQSKGILAILGTRGAGSAVGAVADVFGSGSIGGDLDSAFEGIAGVGLATAEGARTQRGGGAGEAASIGGLATKGGGKVGLGDKAERKVGSVEAAAPEVDGALDGSAVAKVVRGRMRSVQDCYQKELKRDPSLAGKIEIEFTIGEDGRIEDAVVASNQMGSSAVANCIVSRVRLWRFPKPDGGSVTVTFPFIFTSSG